jgi:hypothetical protein
VHVGRSSCKLPTIVIDSGIALQLISDYHNDDHNESQLVASAKDQRHYPAVYSVGAVLGCAADLDCGAGKNLLMWVLLSYYRLDQPTTTHTTTMDPFNIQTTSLHLGLLFVLFVGFLVAVRRIVDYRAAVVGIQYVS